MDGGKVGVDGTQVTANAAISSLEKIQPVLSLEEYLKRLASEESGEQNPEDTEGDGKAGAPRVAGDPNFRGEKFSNQTHRSKTDPDARLYRKGPGQETKLRYMVHDVTHLKSGVILATSASQANTMAERREALKMLDRLRDTPVGKLIKDLYADAQYGAGSFLYEVLKREIEPWVPVRKWKIEGVPTWKRKTWDLGQIVKRKRAVRAALARNHVRRHLMGLRGQIAKARTRIERTFAEAKVCHGLGRARCRGLNEIQIQADMTAIVQNAKRLAGWRRKRVRPAQAAAVVQFGNSSSGEVPAILRRFFAMLTPDPCPVG